MKQVIEWLSIDGLEIQVIRKPIKHAYLRVCHQTGKVRFSVPSHYSKAYINQFICSKRAWIDKHIEQINRKPQLIACQYICGEQHFYQGQLYELKLDSNSRTNCVTINHKTGEILMNTKGELSTSKKSSLLKEWYRTEMKRQLPALITKWERVIGVDSRGWGIRKMTSRWGSCNTHTHKIWLNLELIKKPLICLEYVIVHELVHLLERKHNKLFYSYMNHYMPDWKEYDQLLKNS